MRSERPLWRKVGAQILRDSPKARREIQLHWRASGCKHIVRVEDVYENAFRGRNNLLGLMEW